MGMNFAKKDGKDFIPFKKQNSAVKVLITGRAEVEEICKITKKMLKSSFCLQSVPSSGIPEPRQISKLPTMNLRGFK